MSLIARWTLINLFWITTGNRDRRGRTHLYWTPIVLDGELPPLIVIWCTRTPWQKLLSYHISSVSSRKHMMSLNPHEHLRRRTTRNRPCIYPMIIRVTTKKELPTNPYGNMNARTVRRTPHYRNNITIPLSR